MSDQRRSKRFQLRLPFELVRAGADQVNDTGETMNLSSAGVLFTSRTELEVGAPIEYFITLQPSAGGERAVRLHCLGKVVRRQDSADSEPPAHPAVAVAATMARYEFIRPVR